LALHQKSEGTPRFVEVLLSSRENLHNGSKSVAIAFRANKIQGYPVITGLVPIPKEEWAIAHCSHDDIHVSVVVEIGHGTASRAALGFEIGASCRGRIDVCPWAFVFQEQTFPAHQVVGITIGDEDVQVAVVIKVKEAAAPTHKLRRQASQT